MLVLGFLYLQSFVSLQSLKDTMQSKIDPQQLFEAGYVKKTHGVQGELYLVLEPEVADHLEQYEFLFFLIDGLPVPFRVEGTPTIGDDFAHVSFSHIHNKEQAQQYVGSKILIDHSFIANDLFNMNALIGFLLIDAHLGPLGEIKAVDDYGGNIVLTVWHNKQEVLIPFNEELLIDFQRDSRTLTLNCPSGILD